MNIKELKIVVTLTEPMLGSTPSDKEIADTYIYSV